MKKIKLSIVAFGVLFLTNSTSAIELTDYKVIEGTYNDAYIDGGLSIDGEGNDREQTAYDAFIDVDAKSIYTTAPYTLEYELRGHGDFSRGSENNDSSENSYSTIFEVEADKYFNNDDTYFGYGNLELGYRKQSTADDAEDPFVKIGVGAGYGRQYIATPLASAMRISEDLSQYRIIKKSISDKALVDLARIIGLRDEYESKHGVDEFKQYWYKDMEKSLKENGALESKALDAVGIVRLDQILDTDDTRGQLARLHGWKVRGGIGQILSSYDGQSEDTTVDAYFDYALPFGYSSQLLESARISKNLDNDAVLDYNFANELTYTYELTDKVDWINSWLLNFDKYQRGDDVTINNLSTRFNYYLANQFSLNARFSLSKTDGTNGTSFETPDWDTSFFAGIRYRLQ